MKRHNQLHIAYGAMEVSLKYLHPLNLIAWRQPINITINFSENCMRKIVSFMHVSLDGFVAGANGELNWVKLDSEIFSFVGARIAKTDTALYGRLTYEMMEAYWPTAADKPNPSNHDIEHSKWYKKANKVVISKSLNESDLVNTKVIGNNLIEDIMSLKQTSGSEILLFGSPTATHSLMAEDLIDEYWLFVNPILLSEGIPLFNKIRNKQALTLISSKVFPSGVVCLQYMCGSKRLESE